MVSPVLQPPTHEAEMDALKGGQCLSQSEVSAARMAEHPIEGLSKASSDRQ